MSEVGPFGPVLTTGRAVPFSWEVIVVTKDPVLATVVRTWVDSQLPGDRGAADRAVHIACEAHAHGASVPQACQEARSFVWSWASHPSHWRGAEGNLRQAS